MYAKKEIVLHSETQLQTHKRTLKKKPMGCYAGARRGCHVIELTRGCNQGVTWGAMLQFSVALWWRRAVAWKATVEMVECRITVQMSQIFTEYKCRSHEIGLYIELCFESGSSFWLYRLCVKSGPSKDCVLKRAKLMILFVKCGPSKDYVLKAGQVNDIVC